MTPNKQEQRRIAVKGIFRLQFDGRFPRIMNLAKYICNPFNYQKINPAKEYAVEKIGRREHISAPVFYYDLNLN